jgi:hypothetical protein
MRLFPGTPAPMLLVGVEYGRAANWALARQFLGAARDACPGDPAPHHELGCVALRAGEPAAAQAAFEEALRLAPQPLTDTWEVKARTAAPLRMRTQQRTDAISLTAYLAPRPHSRRCWGWGTRCASWGGGTRRW